MKIGIFIQAYLPKMGGAQVSTHCLASSLMEIGHSVSVLTDPGHISSCKSNNWQFSYQLVPVKTPPRKLLDISYRIWHTWLLNGIKAVARQDNYDIIQLINAWPWISAASYWNSAGTPVVLRAVGDDIQIDKTINYGMRQNKKVDKLISSNYKYLSRVVANSSSTTEQYRKINVPDDKIC